MYCFNLRQKFKNLAALSNVVYFSSVANRNLVKTLGFLLCHF